MSCLHGGCLADLGVPCVQVKTHSVIIATGAVAKRLGLPHEEEFWNSGISACAVCDGASANFRKQELAVVGGGDTAAEEALYLTKYGTKVNHLSILALCDA